jgi:hypothetical protein
MPVTILWVNYYEICCQLGRGIPLHRHIFPTTEDRSNAMTLDVPSGCCGTMSHGGIGEARADADQHYH